MCSLILVNATRFGAAQASTGDSGIPKPAIPEFTVEFVNYVYLEVRIKNQPFVPYYDNSSGWDISLYYNIRAKAHSSDQWTGLYHAEDGYPTPSDSEYTVISVGNLGVNGLSIWAQTRKILDVPYGDQVDFQVEAMIGHVARAGGPPFFDWQLVGETSGWSETQTISIPTPSPAPTPSPSPSPSPAPVNATPTQITISTDASSPIVGSVVNVNGRLSCANGTSLQGKPIILSYAVGENFTWVPIGSGTTDSAGEYSIQWVNPASGTFTVKAERNGNDEYLGASATTTLSFLPYDNQNLFLFESNSTVSALAFNSTSLELSFTVSGTSGTAGYVKVAIAKSIVANAENIKVYLDGNQLDYEVTSNSGSWLLTFTYKHSTHQVMISLAANAGDATFLGIEPWVWIASAIVIGALLTVGIAFARRRRGFQSISLAAQNQK